MSARCSANGSASSAPMRSPEEPFSACKTSSGSGSTPRTSSSIVVFCRAETGANRSRMRYSSILAASSTGRWNWTSRRERWSRSASGSSASSAGRAGWGPAGAPTTSRYAGTPASIRRSASTAAGAQPAQRQWEPTMADISLEVVTGKLNRVGYEAFIQALRHAKSAGNRNVELAHWLAHILQKDRADLALTADHFKLDRGRLLADIGSVVDGFRKNETEMPGVSNTVVDLLDRGWHYATLFFGETQIRTGHVLVGALKSLELRRALTNLSGEFAKIPVDVLSSEHRTIWARSEEENLRPMDGSGLRAAGTPGADADLGARGTTALDRFSTDLTAKARSGEMDPILGRDDEIRQIIDVLMRRRQNNPILTGEAGVGKTAVVEGFARRIAAGDVPPPLKDVTLRVLDVGLLQAGASMKGEFENRLRQVIEEVQSSPKPIILFIDEAHTLIGAGGSAGTGDAANLLKPALARGNLRTIAATTWAEYKKYFEKDPALARRFQVVKVEEPSDERAILMMRGITGMLEKHHGVRILDDAVESSVRLSARYIPGRQLPDKSVSLLDTACARVAIGQIATPPAVEDARRRIEALE